MLVSKKIVFISIFIISFFSNRLALASDLEKMGDILQLAVPTIAGGSSFFREEKKENLEQFAHAYICAIGTTQWLKHIVKEERPNGSNRLSFPSGHSVSAFAGAFYIQERYGFKYALPLYVASLIVGYTRVQSDHHYWHDVAAAAGIAYLSNMAFTTQYKSHTIKFEPIVIENGIQLQLSY